jgi:branched-chain amino acid transport system ATP-binding protein
MLLEVKNISTFYGKIGALKKVSVIVNEKEIVAILGANGSGKSTLLNTISGALRCKEGQIIFKGSPIHELGTERVVRTGISLVPERRRLFGPLTVMENLSLGAYLRYGKGGDAEIRKDMDYVFQVFPILKERREQAAGTLSGGEQMMLAIGRGVMSKPKLLLLDEPSLGLAPLVIEEIFKVIGELRTLETSILIVEQNAVMALGIGDRAYVLEHGEIVLEGIADEVRNNSKVQEAYLGVI